MFLCKVIADRVGFWQIAIPQQQNTNDNLEKSIQLISKEQLQQEILKNDKPLISKEQLQDNLKEGIQINLKVDNNSQNVAKINSTLNKTNGNQNLNPN